MPWNETECAKRGEKIVQLETRANKHDEDLKEIREDVRKIQNRLPVWAVFLFSALTGIIGWLAK